jgi:pentatricopeptide repeat protein
LTALSKERTLESAKQAEQLLFQMQELHDSHGLDTRPNTFAYNTVLNCWASLAQSIRSPKGELSIGTCVRRTNEILNGMKELSEDEQPDVVSYNIAIRTYRNNIKKAISLLREMIDNSIRPNRKTFETLMYVLKHDTTVKEKKDIEAEIQKLCSEKQYPNGIIGASNRAVSQHDKRGDKERRGPDYLRSHAENAIHEIDL